MNQEARPAQVLALGEWQVDAETLSIRRGDEVQQLEPRAFRVLQYLAARPGKLVTIDELMDAHWPDVVVTPNAVTRVIAQIRKALGDDARNPRYIETVARTGYRLVAEVGHAAPRTVPKRAGLLGAAAVAVVLAAIVWWRFGNGDSEAAVAVLPFANLTGDTSLAYLGDSVAEEVINGLAQIPGLDVSARTLSFRHRGDATDLREAARDLDVSYIVEGSVRLSGEQLRITAQLIDVSDGYHVWSQTMQHGRLDVFDAQDAISSGVAAALAEELALESAAAGVDTGKAPDPRAYNLYLRGRYIWHRRGSEPLQPAIDHFAEAVRIDPSFAKGWGALASAYLTYPGYSPEGYATWHLAEDAAKKALELDSSIAEAYSVLAVFAETRRDWAEARSLFEEGLRRAPDSVTAHYWYAEFLAKTGYYVDSLAELERALELDPTFLAPQADIAIAFLMFGDYERATAYATEAWNRGLRSPVSWSALFLGHSMLGDTNKLREIIDRADFGDAIKQTMHRFVAIGEGAADGTFAQDVLNGDAPTPDYRLAVWMLARSGAYAESVAVVTRRLERGLTADPRPLWSPGTGLQEQPEFHALLDELGLVEFWEESGYADTCYPEDRTLVCDQRVLNPDNLQRLLAEDVAANH